MMFSIDSVDNILSKFNRIIARLDDHSQAKADERDMHHDAVDRHSTMAEAAHGESVRASTIADNIRRLVATQ